MTITNAAAEIIQRWLQGSSDLSYPVIYLAQTSDASPEVNEALKRGVSREELEALARKDMKVMPKCVWPAIYPGARFIWLTSTINGFRFASRLFYPPAVRRAMKDGVLDAAERGLVLKAADGTVVLPANATGAL